MKLLFPVIAVLGLAAPVQAETIESLLADAGTLTPDVVAPEPQAFEDADVAEDRAVSEPVAEELPQPQASRLNACTAEEGQQLRGLGREYALSLVRNDFLGGQEIESLVEDCTFDGAIYEGILHIRWRGALLGWNEYNVWGRLRTFPDGSNATFAPRGASESVQALQFWGNLGTIGLQLVP